MTDEVLLSLDYGEARIGVARSYGTLAEPLGILDNNETSLQDILLICQEHHVDRIIVGLSENKMAEKTRMFAGKLGQLTTIPIEFQDETLSSSEVHTRLASQRAGKRQARGYIDHYAAALILERWLEDHA